MSEQQLCLALQDHLDWEPEMVESIVAALKQAAVRNATPEIEDIIQVRHRFTDLHSDVAPARQCNWYHEPGPAFEAGCHASANHVRCQ